MWANHDWMHIHPANLLNKPEILAHGSVLIDAFNRIVDHVDKHYFSQPNYLLLDGKLDFSIYEIGRFIGGRGGLDGACRAVDAIRPGARRAGHADIHFNRIVWGLSVLPGEMAACYAVLVARELGVASVRTSAWVIRADAWSNNASAGCRTTEASARSLRNWRSTSAECSNSG